VHDRPVGQEFNLRHCAGETIASPEANDTIRLGRLITRRGTILMSADESVSAWIAGLKAGHEAAAARVWNHFYARLLALARRRLGDAPRRAADEEDVVASAFGSFFRRVQEGHYPRLGDRDGLWHLLVRITECKALNQLRDQGRQKRGGGRVLGESGFLRPDLSSGTPGIDQVPGAEPTPEFAAALADSLDQLLRLLDVDLRQIALLKLEGRTNEEIADMTDRSLPTVERRLKLIRDKWKKKME
jgi:RNA polymerase sigma factor (sigma-70 family)